MLAGVGLTLSLYSDPEFLETALASVAGDREELANEAADLLYHLLVMYLRPARRRLPYRRQRMVRKLKC